MRSAREEQKAKTTIDPEQEPADDPEKTEEQKKKEAAKEAAKKFNKALSELKSTYNKMNLELSEVEVTKGRLKQRTHWGPGPLNYLTEQTTKWQTKCNSINERCVAEKLWNDKKTTPPRSSLHMPRRWMNLVHNYTKLTKPSL